MTATATTKERIKFWFWAIVSYLLVWVALKGC
jgi:hypothetical protein